MKFWPQLLGSAESNDRLSGESLRNARNRRVTIGSQEGYGTSAVLPERGIYLTSAVYRPILQVYFHKWLLATEIWYVFCIELLYIL